MLVFVVIFSAVAFVVLAALFIIPILVLSHLLGRRFNQEQFESADYGITSKRITLKTDDGLNLAAWRTQSENVKGTVIIISGIQNPSVTAYFGCAKMYADNGWDSLLIEMRARSLSEGETIGFGMTEWRDVKAGVNFLMSDIRAKDLPIVAMGTSMGGGTVITAAGELREITAVIALSAFSSFTNMIAEVMPVFGIPKFIAHMTKPFFKFHTGFRLGFDVLKYTPLYGIEKLGPRPLLLMHSTGDTEVSFSQHEKLLEKAKACNVKIKTFTREGDEHFIFSSENIKNPAQDTEAYQSIMDFLNDLHMSR